MSSLGILANNTVIYDKLPYDPFRRTSRPSRRSPTSRPSSSAGMDLPYKNIKEMVAYAKANPGKINRGSPGASILTNLAPMAFEKQAGITAVRLNEPWQAVEQALAWVCGRFHLVPI
jgi:tripartite-type tricarboxylate transporter receptor subunit TctC